MSVASLIDDNGGPAAFAEKVGKTAGAVRVWKHRNQLPREAWPEIIQAIPSVTLAELMRLEAETAPAPAPTDEAA